MSYDDTEHECPTPLEREVNEFDVGGMFLSPAGRWETITSRTPHAKQPVQIVLHTDAVPGGCVWTFWRSNKFPYLPGYRVGGKYVVVSETSDDITVEVADSPRSWGHGHTLVSARMVRGSGWVISDVRDGSTVETVTVANRAKARAEVNRRARAHAKRLGLSVWRPEVTR